MLDEVRLKNKLKEALENITGAGDTREAQLEYWCEYVAKAIVEEIKEAKINYNNGLMAGATPVTGVFNHTVT